ncbi:MAG TPA: HAMP domain-containing protein [bacterium]|nr:HAMP domain-containing protein [bacterium]
MIKLLKTFSLRSRIIIIYVFILGAGGLITSLIGSIIVNKAIMTQAKNKVHHDLKTARMVYDKRLTIIETAVYLGATGNTIQQAMKSGDNRRLHSRLTQIAKDSGMDFLSITDDRGIVKLRITDSPTVGDDVSTISVIQTALKGKIAAATEILPSQILANEDPALAEKAVIKVIETRRAKPTTQEVETSGMVLIAACPVMNEDGQIIGVLYGGYLLNNNFQIVDRVRELVYKGDRYQNREIGTVTIFLKDLRISTNVENSEEKRAVGTRVSDEVYQAVIVNKQRWAYRAFVVNDWYISEYEPILNYNDEVVGILYVGVLEKAYISIRNRVIYTFFAIASFGFVVIIAISYLITRSITRPLSEMVEVTDLIAAGKLDREVKVKSKDEIGQLAYSFNRMVTSLRKMRLELEEWGNTLEQKVKQRTEELAAMQNTLMQSQRLASVGKLAAGIAHEINNPLGGILVLSSLVMEDLKSDDPHRENLLEVIKQTMRCRDIVKGLLQFSRQEEGKTEYLNVNDVLSNTLSLIEKQALFHNIKVTKNLNPELPSILGDNSQLQQVFMNIILNAVQAMDDVGELTINTYHDQKNDMVVTEVSDTGCGIPDELIDRIFDPFFTTKEVGEGTGLGLAIAYGIITKHQGRMTVKSKVGEGTTFTIKIPVVEAVRQS